MSEDNEMRGRLLAVTALATEYCATLEHAYDMERDELVARMLGLLPRLYWEFSDIPGDAGDVSLDEDDGYWPEYVEEEQYEAVRKSVAAVLGEDDSYLETVEEDMKYSDTPIGASIAEGLADIFQPLFNFASVVRESEGESLTGAFRACKSAFESYWAQTLCNVMRPLNALRYS